MKWWTSHRNLAEIFYLLIDDLNAGAVHVAREHHVICEQIPICVFCMDWATAQDLAEAFGGRTVIEQQLRREVGRKRTACSSRWGWGGWNRHLCRFIMMLTRGISRVKHTFSRHERHRPEAELTEFRQAMTDPVWDMRVPVDLMQ